MEEKDIYSPEFIPFYLEEVNRFKLTPIEGLVYGFIRFYTKNSSSFYFSSKDFGRIVCGISDKTINNIISKLKSLGLIDTEVIRYNNGDGIKSRRKITLLSSYSDNIISSYSDIKKNNKNNNKENNNILSNDNILLQKKQKSFLEIFEKEINNEEFISILKAKYNLEDAYLKKVAGDFCLYRTEKNPNGRKEKWQMQKTFDIKRRFYTRLSNDQKYSKKTNFTPKNSIGVIE